MLHFRNGLYFVSVLTLQSLIANPSEAESAPEVYTTLGERRPEIVLPGYTPEEKLRVALQAETILRDVYVNREVKMDSYGAHVNPIPQVADIVANATILSENILHQRLETLFTSQHDLHLSYSYPIPHACYRSVLPFSLSEAVAPGGEKVIAVTSVASLTAIYDLAPEARQISVGDILVSYNDIDPAAAAADLIGSSRGSNEFGRVRRAIENLTFRSHRWNRLPEEDIVLLTFRNRTGQEYAVEVPWISRADLACLGFNEPNESFKRERLKQDNMGLDTYQLEYEEFYKPHQRTPESESLHPTDEPIIHYDVLQNEFGTYGYLRLDSFVPQQYSVNGAVLIVKGLLEKQLSHTDGLIIDLRDNGGGLISFAESLVQLFTPSNIQPQGFRLQNTKVVRDLFDAIPGWSADYRQALAVATTIGAKYTQALPLTSQQQANRLGQSYFKPVAVLTNSSCYSSCDMMSALLQDFGVATIFGEDGRTGGGGANNVQLDFFTNALPSGHTQPFAVLPGNQSMGVAWRQTVRVGKNSGFLLEEAGVQADRIATPSIADFFANDLFQFRQISEHLNRMNQSANVRQSWYKFENPGSIDLYVDETPEMKLLVSNTDAIEMRLNGRSLGYEAVGAPSSAGGIVVAVHPAIDPADGPWGNLELIGYKNGERTWRAVQVYRFVPKKTVIGDSDSINLDFSSPTISPLVIYNDGDDATAAWSVRNGSLKTGSGEQYQNYTFTYASLFLDLSNRTAPLNLSFDFSGKTEKDYDFFSVSIYADGIEKQIVAPVSGELPLKKVLEELTQFNGKTVEISFVFKSDSSETDVGVVIDNITVE